MEGSYSVPHTMLAQPRLQVSNFLPWALRAASYCVAILTRLLATCSADTTVNIWSIKPNYDVVKDKTLNGHQRWVWDCAFSADSAYLVTGTSVATAGGSSRADGLPVAGLALRFLSSQLHRTTSPACGSCLPARRFGSTMDTAKLLYVWL